jgi:hypothetical protein
MTPLAALAEGQTVDLGSKITGWILRRWKTLLQDDNKERKKLYCR